MHRAGLTLLLAAASFACKKEAPVAPKIEEKKPAEAPQEIVYAASSALRVIDARQGKVIASIPIQHTIYSIQFSLDGSAAYLATGAGVFEVDANAHRLRGQLTDRPASWAAVDASGSKLEVLEHEVIVHKDGTRDIEPFHWVALDLTAGAKPIADEEIGQRVMFVVPPREDRHHLVVTADGEVRLGKPKTRLADGAAVALKGTAKDEKARVRHMVATRGNSAFVPVEGATSEVVEIDLVSGDSRAMSLERSVRIRGMAATPDGKSLLVNAVGELIVVDLETRAVRSALELPGAHVGLAISDDGKWAFLAQTVDGTGGAVTIVRLDPLAVHAKVHLDDISPWTVAVRPRAGMASL
jgi:hypothetical protein